MMSRFGFRIFPRRLRRKQAPAGEIPVRFSLLLLTPLSPCATMVSECEKFLLNHMGELLYEQNFLYSKNDRVAINYSFEDIWNNRIDNT